MSAETSRAFSNTLSYILMDAAESGVDTYLYELLDDFSDPTGSKFGDHFGVPT